LNLKAARREDVTFVVREFVCPGCGTLLDAQVVAAGSPIVFDSKPSFYIEAGVMMDKRQSRLDDAGVRRKEG
jgi:acetone carboxylase gamma subunit